MLCKQDKRQLIASNKVMQPSIGDGVLPDAPRRAIIEDVAVTNTVGLASYMRLAGKRERCVTRKDYRCHEEGRNEPDKSGSQHLSNLLYSAPFIPLVDQ